MYLCIIVLTITLSILFDKRVNKLGKLFKWVFFLLILKATNRHPFQLIFQL